MKLGLKAFSPVILVLAFFGLESLGQEKIPKIIMDAENVYGFPEQFRFLRVKTNNVPGAQYSWLKDGKKITKKTKPSFMASDQTILVSADTNKDSLEYAGIYQFVMSTTAGTIKGRKITVNFTYVGTFDSSFPKDYNINVTVGQANFIKCPNHQPGAHVNYKWGKYISGGGIKFMAPKPSYIVLDDGTLFYSHLTAANVMQFNRNGWKCGMEATSERNIRFVWAVHVITQLKVNITNTTEFGPSIVTTLPKNRQFQVGDTITMKCAAKGRPTPVYSWKRVDVYNNEFPVKDGEDGITFENGDTRLLVIRKAKRDHAGQYFCTATTGDKNDTVVGLLSFEDKPQWVVEDMKSVQPSIYSRYSWTCNATGIPRPTYKWLKDGKDLVTSNKHVINGGIIVFPRLEKEDTGMYECVADNGLDNIYQTAYLDVQGPPDAPNKVIIDGDCSSFSAKLVWNITDSNYVPVKYFIIQARTTYDGSEVPWRNISDNVPAGPNKKTIGNLSPYSSYIFRVLAINKIGTSAPSKPTLIGDCKTPQRAPTKCPMIKGAPGKENELELKWQKMDLIDHNGKDFHYSLVYSSLKPPFTSKPVKFKPYVLKYKIPNAGYYQTWSFKIQGVNDAGSGPFCHGISHSGQSAPSRRPLDFGVKEFGVFYFILHWKKITLDRGSVDGYKLTYYPKPSFSKSRRSIGIENCNKYNPCTRDIVGGSKTTLRLEGLLPNTDYRLALAGYNSGGLGPESSITAKTEEGTPGVPAGFKATTYSNFIKVEWEPPQRPNGIITAYKVTIIDKDSKPNHVIVDGSTRIYLFGGLNPMENYLVTIQARTRKGFGEKKMLRIRTKALQTKSNDKLLSIYIKSEGCDDPGTKDCGHATIRVNGLDYSKQGRGYNVVVVNADTGVVESSTTFDTYGDPIDHHGLIYHLSKIPVRKLVLVAVQDASAERMSTIGYNALKKFGAKNQLKTFRHSFALLGWSGYGKLDAITQVQRDRYKGPSIISKVLSLPL